MSPATRRIVLDVLKPHEPEMLTVADEVADCPGVDSVNVVLVETDREVQSLKLTIEGSAIEADTVEETIERIGASIHSVDQVVCGDSIVEQVDTPQDR
ncbi:MAG: DUF211 domain-containing protein [Halovenus sp.]|uniref:DUF211 domain-containing protein n=1 Tax=Halovenus amylolytica TaxID=2500550 RepID=UPI000FE397CA